MHKRRGSGKDWVADLSTGKFAAGLLVTALTIALALAGLVVLGFAGAYQFLEPDIPEAAELRDLRTQMPLAVYSLDGKLIAQIGEQRRLPVEWQDLPPRLVDAFLAAEDDRFFEHPGVDWRSLVRAAASNVSAGGVREGGGTITMQLARNTVLTSERTLRRKLKEVFLALRLEREFTKQEILTQYLNRIFLGQRAYGVGAAAQVYFDKRPAELNLAEAALIAGLPRSPSLDNPVASVQRARDRRAYVLRRMLETGKVTQAEHDAAAAEPIVARTYGPMVELDAPFIAEMARLEMVRMHGDAALNSGFQVTTTVDSRLQAAADAAARRTLLEYDRRHGYRGPRSPARCGGARRCCGARGGPARVPGARRPGERPRRVGRRAQRDRTPTRRHVRRTRLGRHVVGTRSAARRRARCGTAHGARGAGARPGGLPRAAAGGPAPPRAAAGRRGRAGGDRAARRRDHRACPAASTSGRASTTARSRRGASRARPSSRSSTPRPWSGASRRRA